jgi:chorismate synthase
VDLATGEPAPTNYERSDFSAVPRAVVIGEAMAAWVLADALLEKLGGGFVGGAIAALRHFAAEPAGGPADG